MADDGTGLGAKAAGTLAAAQGSADKAVKDLPQVDGDEVSQHVQEGADAAFGEAKESMDKAINDTQHIEEGAGGVLKEASTALENAMKDVQQTDWASIAEALQKDGATAFEAAKEAFGKIIEGLKNIKWEEIPESAGRYIEEHPVLTAIQVAALLLVVCPWLLSEPALGVVGFGGVGPTAGSFAAWHQSVYGTGFIFSGLQSAAMGGYGAAAVNGAIQGSALATLVAAEVHKHTGAEELRNHGYAQHEHDS